MSKLKSLRSTVSALAVGVGLIGVPASALASAYSHSAPQFDEVTMLRVAMAYNLSNKVVDVSFPATNPEACNFAGLGAITFVGKDHNPWAVSEAGAAYRESVNAVLGQDHAFCGWLHSDAANAAVPGISRAWDATLKTNFKRLRKSLRKANCDGVYRALDRYPAADLPRDRIHRKVFVGMGRQCRS